MANCYRRDPDSLLRKAHLAPDFPAELALATLQDKGINKAVQGDIYINLAIQLLIDIDHPNLAHLLMQRLMAAYSQQEYFTDDEFLAWQVTEWMVKYAAKGETQRQNMISQLVPQAFGTDVNLQIMAIETLADLGASEQCPRLFGYLNDRTLVIAYTIVGAIKRFQPDNDACKLLLDRLSSPRRRCSLFCHAGSGRIRPARIRSTTSEDGK